MNIIPSQCIASSIPLSEQGFVSGVKIKLIRLYKTTASDLSLIEITPTNLSRDPLIAKKQIRRHLQLLGHPIVGKSNKFTMPFRGEKGIYCCLNTIKFTHPISGQEMHFQEEVPSKFKSLLDREDRYFNM